MAFRTVVINKKSKLEFKLNYLVIRSNEEIQKIFVDEISVLIIEETAVCLTVVLLQELAHRNIDTIFCDRSRYPCSLLQPLYGCERQNISISYQIHWSQEIKDLVWTEIVKDKIRKQHVIITQFNMREDDYFKNKIESVTLGDSTNIEAQVARKYFRLLFGNTFTRHADNPINKALNYGYGVLLSTVTREIVKNGYLTELGINHSNVHNLFNLGCDFMEPFRPIIDQKVKEMCPFDSFSTGIKHELLEIFSYQFEINNKKYDFIKTIEIYCSQLLKALKEENIKLIKFYHYE